MQLQRPSIEISEKPLKPKIGAILYSILYALGLKRVKQIMSDSFWFWTIAS